jgi:hypothetical protein
VFHQLIIQHSHVIVHGNGLVQYALNQHAPQFYEQQLNPQIAQITIQICVSFLLHVDIARLADGSIVNRFVNRVVFRAALVHKRTQPMKSLINTSIFLFILLFLNYVVCAKLKIKSFIFF